MEGSFSFWPSPIVAEGLKDAESGCWNGSYSLCLVLVKSGKFSEEGTAWVKF